MHGKRAAATRAVMSEADVRAAFLREGEWCARLGAPLTARLRGRLGVVLDRTTAVGARVLDWPGDPYADALMVRLAGGLHAHVRDGTALPLAAHFAPGAMLDDASFDAGLAAALADERLLPWLDTPPQTNEVGRSGVLYPGLLTIAAVYGLPLRLFELGASAGLNLRLDRYGYRLGTLDAGPAGASVHLAPAWSGPPPPATGIRVDSRRGVDLAPVDLRDPAARERLLAYVWPDQRDRLARAEAAIAAFVADPVPLDTGDAAAWVEAQVTPQPGTATVVLHSIAFKYFPDTTKARIAAHLDREGARATADAPLAWLRLEADDPRAPEQPTLRLRTWPGDDRLLAYTHPHGASVEWLG